jgi:dihydrodipicolinate synthase/N-acetylneuraminate lyase
MLRSDDVSFSGVHPAVLTPFGESRELRVDALREAVDWLIECGVDGIVGLGTLAEFRSLAADERRSVLEAIIESVAGRVPVTIGISAETSEQAVELADEATTAGAQALMCLPPLIYHAADSELVAFFDEVAKASSLPLMVYNNPTGSRNDLSPALIARLFELETIAAVKECSGDVRRIPAILELTGGRMQVLVGGDDWALEGACAGAVGWVSGVANAAPAECKELWYLCTTGDLEAANRLYRSLLPLARLDMHPKLVQFFKGALDRSGRFGGPTRSPRLPLSPEEETMLDRAMDALRSAPVA